MAKDDSELRRQRLREMRERRLDRGGESSGSSGSPEERIDRALAERRRASNEGDARTGQRPLERFPRLREALEKRRQSQGGGGEREGPFARPRREAIAAEGNGRGRVMFARRLRDVRPTEGEDDVGLKLERLERRMGRLRAELDRSAEELRRLRSPQQENPAAAQENTLPPEVTLASETRTSEPEPLSALLKVDAESESLTESDPDKSRR
jgi:hypothetical protein